MPRPEVVASSSTAGRTLSDADLAAIVAELRHEPHQPHSFVQSLADPSVILQAGTIVLGALIVAVVVRVEVRYLRAAVDEMRDTFRTVFGRLDDTDKRVAYMQGRHDAQRELRGEPAHR